MNTPYVHRSEYRLCLLVWEHEPIKSTALVRLCKSRLHWSKSTTYTVIRRLSEKGILENKDSIIHSLITKEIIQDILLVDFLINYFEGSISDLSVAVTRIQKAAC